MAVKQFEDSDVSFLASYYGMNFFHDFGVPSMVLLVVLLLIWQKPLRKLFGLVAAVAMIVAIGQFVGSTDALAFATNSNDVDEWRYIESDETAFLIPLFGDTIDNQAQYRPDYLNGPNVKVPGKFIKIPHSKLSGTGGSSGLAKMFGSDYYVNTSFLLKTKRSRYSRVWVQPGRGTAKNIDESFPCQTKLGHNVKKIGVTAIFRIEDKDAALYVSNWGMEPLDSRLDKNKIENVFISDRYARSLISVVDDFGYSLVQGMVCEQIANFDDPEVASQNMNQIMAAVREQLKTEMAKTGIIVEKVGWADTWTFDDDVQAAINQKFNAKMVAASLDILRANADINLKEGMAAGFRKGMPSFLAVPESLMAPLAGIAKTLPQVPAH